MALPIRPTIDAAFASGGSAEIIEPGASKKLLGWLGTEKPPHQYFNWLHFIVWKWQIYLDRRTKITETFSGTSLVLPTDRCRRYHMNAASSAQTLVLPAISADDNDLEFDVKKVDSSANVITINGTVEGEVNPTIDYQYTGRSFYAFGGAWYWSK